MSEEANATLREDAIKEVADTRKSDKEKKNNEKMEALKSGNILDLYDEEGNPLYETDTDSDDSDSE